MLEKKEKKVVGLFAGIGGLELGLHRAGYQSTMLCEIDQSAQHVLRARFPDTEILSDVREIDNSISADVLCAGFPCQDLSSIGQKNGISGSQSSLIDEVFRILKVSDIDLVVVENVRFMLHLNKGEAMTRVVTGFERLGYKWAYRVVNSLAFGVPQRRHRVFFVASKTRDPRDILLSDNFLEPTEQGGGLTLDDHIGFYWTEGAYAAGLSRNAIPPLKAGSTIGIPSPPAILFPSGLVGTPDIRDAERLQGFEADWTLPAEEFGRASLRWRLLGNAVTVPVAEWVAERIQSPKAYDSSKDRPLEGKWPNAAWSMGDGRFRAECSDWPASREFIPIGDFLRFQPKLLSRKATNGFVSRALKGNLKFPTGFIDALTKHLDKV